MIDQPILRAARLASGETKVHIDSGLRAGHWIAPFRGVHLRAPATAAAWSDAALLTQHSEAAFSHRLAAARLELPCIPREWHGLEIPELAMPTLPRRDKHRRREGLLLREAPLPDASVQLVGGLRVTSPARTLVDLVRDGCVTRTDGVILMDAAIKAKRCTREQLEAALDPLVRRRGIVLARRVVELCRPGVGSPGESRLRLALVDGGIDPATIDVNIEICDDAGLVMAAADLGVAELMLWGEYDGFDVHTGRGSFAKDRRGDRWLERRGWHILRFTHEDVVDPSQMLLDWRLAVAHAPARIMAMDDSRSPELARAKQKLMAAG